MTGTRYMRCLGQAMKPHNRRARKSFALEPVLTESCKAHEAGRVTPVPLTFSLLESFAMTPEEVRWCMPACSPNPSTPQGLTAHQHSHPSWSVPHPFYTAGPNTPSTHAGSHPVHTRSMSVCTVATISLWRKLRSATPGEYSITIFSTLNLVSSCCAPANTLHSQPSTSTCVVHQLSSSDVDI